MKPLATAGPYCMGCNAQYELVREVAGAKPVPNMVSFGDQNLPGYPVGTAKTMKGWLCAECTRELNCKFAKLKRVSLKMDQEPT